MVTITPVKCFTACSNVFPLGGSILGGLGKFGKRCNVEKTEERIENMYLYYFCVSMILSRTFLRQKGLNKLSRGLKKQLFECILCNFEVFFLRQAGVPLYLAAVIVSIVLHLRVLVFVFLCACISFLLYTILYIVLYISCIEVPSQQLSHGTGQAAASIFKLNLKRCHKPNLCGHMAVFVIVFLYKFVFVNIFALDKRLPQS